MISLTSKCRRIVAHAKDDEDFAASHERAVHYAKQLIAAAEAGEVKRVADSIIGNIVATYGVVAHLTAQPKAAE